MQAAYIPASSDFAIYGHKLRALLLLVTHSLRRQAYGRVCSPVRAGHGLLRIWGLSPTWITFSLPLSVVTLSANSLMRSSKVAENSRNCTGC